MPDCADLLLDIRGAGEPVDGAPSRLRFEAVAQVQGSGQRRGMIEVNLDALDIGNPIEYGDALGSAIGNPALQAALVEAAAQARVVRLRLQVDERAPALHQIRWELLRLPVGGDVEAASSGQFAFSRYVALAEQDHTPPSDPTFRVLVAFANPLGLGEGLEIPVEREIASLLDEFEKLPDIARLRVQVMPGRTPIGKDLERRIQQAGWTQIPGCASVREIQGVLQRDCHALHLVCHGKAVRGRGELTLEDDAGGRIQVQESLLASWYHPRLQLIIFQSCKTASPPPDGVPPFTSIAGSMMLLGVPAVVAMQDFIAMDDARHFSAAFYRSLLRDGLVDVAANRGRQAMKEQSGEKNWSIPALYSRLKGGLLWSPDSVREYVSKARRELRGTDEGCELPLKVVEHTAGLSYDPARGALGSWFGMGARVSELLNGSPVTAVLTGPQGSCKAAHVRRLFVELAGQFLAPSAGPQPAAPVLARLDDFSPWTYGSGRATEQLFEDFRLIASDHAIPERLRGSKFAFLIAPGSLLSRTARSEALGCLERLIESFPGSSCLLAYDETQLSELRPFFSDAKVLVVQPMNWLEVQAYLREHDPKLLAKLYSSRLDDLATSPWLLGQMREQARVRGVDRALRSRADVLAGCVSRLLGKFDNARIPLSAAEAVLEAIAWNIQLRRPSVRDILGACILKQADTDRIMSEIRGAGEFSIIDMRRGLVECGLLTLSGEGDVRFPHPSVQAYLAARYLAKSPQREAVVDELAATFGRLGRLRYWTETLVIAAALPQFERLRGWLLDNILTGSSLLEGEQLFLAARLYVEMSQSEAAQEPEFTGADFRNRVRQIVDSLVWRARDAQARPYQDRRAAVEHLADMCHPDAVPHLIQIACDKIRSLDPRKGTHSGQHEYAGLRFLAMDGLFQQIEETLAEVKKRPDAATLEEVICAWQEMYANPERSGKILSILSSDDPFRAPIAAFALLRFGPDVVERDLLPIYWNQLQNWELLWCITEGLAWMDSDWLAAKVIDPAIQRDWMPDSSDSSNATGTPSQPLRNDLRTMLCFLIRELGDAPLGSPRRTYLERSLASGDPGTRIWALRALARLPDRDEGGLNSPKPRLIAEAILQGHTEILSALKIEADWRWKQGALEALRDAGDRESAEIIRDVRLSLNDPVLFRLSFQVAEEIYWRCSGGMIQATT